MSPSVSWLREGGSRRPSERCTDSDDKTSQKLLAHNETIHSKKHKPRCVLHQTVSASLNPLTPPSRTNISFLACSVIVILLCVHIESIAASSVADELLQMQFRSPGGGGGGGGGGECSLDCSDRKTRPVCGTDGVTYPTKCHVRRARKCQGNPGLDVASKGRCKAAKSPGRPSCFHERQRAVANHDGTSAAGSYVPKCNADNTYTEVQCYSYRGDETCWCVTPDGKPITGSFKPSGQSGDVDCSQFIKGKARRRAVRGHKTRRGVSEGCGKTDKAKFNQNLITLFTQEYSRTPEANATSGSLGNYEKRVVGWKFSQLDIDNNGYIKRGEIRDLKRMVKKHVRPKSCARKFDVSCDLDNNKKIDRSEWSVCLGLDQRNDEEEEGRTQEPELSEGRRRGEKGRKKPPKESPPRGSAPGLLESLMERGGPGNVPFGLKPSSEEHLDASSEYVERENQGCNNERQSALEDDRRNPDGRVFIPECADNDKYKKVQCHSTGYCWCVNESTGSPMPGPATFNETPDCENIKVTVFKGCPFPLKRRFLQELLDELSIEMAEAPSNSSHSVRMPEPDPEHTLEETAVRWKLHMLDKNHNNMLERRETEGFKKQIRKKKSLRKCSRNFLRYCDEDENGKITMDEWIECMGITEQKSRPGSTVRRGENPLGRYLKSSG